MKFTPLRHQQIALDFSLTRQTSGLFLDMGLGKTVTTLSLLNILINSFSVDKPLIIGPKFVAEDTWPKEIAKWDHTKHITYAVITGSVQERLAALRAKVDVHILNIEHLAWLVDLKRFKTRWPFDMLVVDELSKFKSSDSIRFRKLRKVLPQVPRLIGLTGTPIPNGMLDLWAQVFILDRGKRLFPTVTTYRMHYFHPEKKLIHGGCTYGINPGAEELIYEKIDDLCLSMKAVDWLQLPERQDIIREIELPDLSEYKQFKRDKILELAEGDITAFNAPALYNKLLQYANGAVYDSDKKYHVVHDLKLEALAEAVEELQGKPVIIAYQFQSDVDRIKKRIPQAVQLKKNSQITEWNKGKIPVMLGHAAGIGHGLNLQYGGHYIFWYGVSANMGDYWQLVKRLDRQGQKFTVFNYHFLVKGTAEHSVYRSIQSKTLTQDRLMDALRKY